MVDHPHCLASLSLRRCSRRSLFSLCFSSAFFLFVFVSFSFGCLVLLGQHCRWLCCWWVVWSHLCCLFFPYCGDCVVGVCTSPVVWLGLLLAVLLVSFVLLCQLCSVGVFLPFCSIWWQLWCGSLIALFHPCDIELPDIARKG